MPNLRLTKVFRFNAYHELRLVDEPVHGHHFALEVGLKLDQDLKVLSDRLEAYWNMKLKPKLHQQNLSEALFPATGENILSWIYGEIKKSEFGKGLETLALQETKKNRFELDLAARH